MKRLIIAAIKSKLKEVDFNWSDAYVKHKYQSSLDTPDAKKQVESAKLAMELAKQQKEFLQELLKEETKK